MSTIVVWVCIMWTGTNYVVIDNIATEQNCIGVSKAFNANVGPNYGAVCIPVRKVNP